MELLRFVVVVFVAALCIVETEEASAESILVEVKHIERGLNGEDLETVLKVNLNVVSKDGIVHVNGKKINHTVVNAVHTKVELDVYSTAGVLMRHTRARIQVRVLVTEGVDAASNAKTLTVQEEIVEVNRDVVTQVHVKEVVMHLDAGNQEIKRIVTTVAVSQSRIHKISRDHDLHCYHRRGHGKLPHPPFHATRGDMRHMKGMHVPESHLRPPQFPDHPMRGEEGMFDGSDDDDDDHHRWMGTRRRNHHHRRHHGFGKKACRWFHRLPIGVRVVMVISAVFLGLVMLTCCVQCCRKRRAASGQAYELPGKAAGKEDLYYDAEIDEAEPLPVKQSLDKAQLIVA